MLPPNGGYFFLTAAVKAAKNQDLADSWFAFSCESSNDWFSDKRTALFEEKRRVDSFNLIFSPRFFPTFFRCVGTFWARDYSKSAGKLNKIS
jgi:hypothetical protein